VALSFDADIAGQAAAERGIDTALALGFNIKVIRLPKEIDGAAIKDPDDCLKHGVKYWQKAIDESVSIMDFYFEKTLAKFDKTNPTDRKEINSRLLKQIAKLPDRVEQDYWLKKLAAILEVPENILRESYATFLDKKVHNPEQIPAEMNKMSREDMLCRQIISIVLKYPQNLDYVIDHLEVEMLPQAELQKIYREMILYYNKDKEFDYSKFENLLQTKEKELVNECSTLLLLADKDFFDFNDNQIEKELIDIISSLKRNYIAKKIKQVQRLLEHAEKEKNSNQIQELSKEFSVLTEKLNNL
jgi:DNA primase